MNSKKSLQNNPQYQAKLLQAERVKQENEKLPERSDLLDDDDDDDDENNKEENVNDIETDTKSVEELIDDKAE